MRYGPRSATFHVALRMGDTAQAEAILADVVIRYLQRKPNARRH